MDFSSNGRPKADRNKAVKQFSRSAAGQRQPSPDELRPLPVLLQTTKYLMFRIVPSKEARWNDVYHFVWDRLWSVRQDMTIQHACGPDCIRILEQAVRFYVYSSFRSCEEDLNNFDPHINCQHLQECLKRLLVLYQECGQGDQPHRPEMEAIYLLHNLGSTEALCHAVSLPQHLRRHTLVHTAMETSLAHRRRNFVRVLRNYRTFPFLLACALHQHMEAIRRNALLIMIPAFSSRNCKFPVAVLSRWLFCRDDEVRKLCLYYRVPLENSEVRFLKGSGDFSEKQVGCATWSSVSLFCFA